MKNVMTIFRRDFAAYFTSPVGYIYMMVFVTLSVGLYITSFFIYPMADMRPISITCRFYCACSSPR
ncbi:MAG TPA: hypothetical protein PLH06_04440 [Candidatus Hydrogenedentes bacterium]|nr:hypothetical protein [Candidatus Hydrogenedentota bacterium]